MKPNLFRTIILPLLRRGLGGGCFIGREAHLSYCRQFKLTAMGKALHATPLHCLLLLRYGRIIIRPYCLLLLLTATLCAPAFAQTPNLTVCAGKGYTLTSVADAVGASGGVTYTWYESVNGADASTIPNSNTSSYSFAAGKAEAGTYAYVRKASNTECPGGVFSNTYTVVVQGTTPVVASVSASTLCAGGTSKLTATVSSGATSAMTYTWMVGSTSSTTSVNTKTTQALGSNTAFTVTVTNEIGCTSAPYSGTITVTTGAASGQTANACGCASGLYDCGGTCQSSSSNNGASFTTCSGVTRVACARLSSYMDWSTANTSCPYGWRLPTCEEATCICANRPSSPDMFFYGSVFWTSTSTKAGTHCRVGRDASGCFTQPQHNDVFALYVWCVK